MKTLILIHGFLGNARNWQPIVHQLKNGELANWDIRAIDLLGHGSKINPDVEINFTNLVEDLRQELSKFDELYVLGHSFGFKPLLTLAAESPQKFKLILAEDSGPFMSQGAFEEVSKVFSELKPPYQSRDQARDEIYKVFGHSSNMSRFLLSLIREKNVGEHDWNFRTTELKKMLHHSKVHDQWSLWKTYPSNITVFRGLKSKYLQEEDWQRMKENRGGLPLEYELFPDSGHWIHAEEPAHFVQKLVQSLLKH